jgi:hypothetical protein
VRTQWREVADMGMGSDGRVYCKRVRTGLDYKPVIELIRALEWDLLTTLDMVQGIELEVIKADGSDE